MDDEVELAPFGLDLGEDRVDRSAVGDVAMADDDGVEFGGERLARASSARRPDR